MDNSKKQELIEKYKLSTQELDRIGNPIADLAAARLTSQNEPRLIFTGGQAGAGKSSISDLQVDRFQKDIAIVDTDLYRNNHPKVKEIQELYPSIASNITHQAGAEIATRVGKAAFEKNANVIYDQTSRTVDGIRAVHDKVKENNLPHKIELHIMATDLDTSRMRVHSRYEEGGGMQGGGRYVDENFQKMSYNGIAETVKQVEQEKIVDHIALYNKKGEVFYENSLENGEWKHKPTAYEKFNQERERDLSPLEKKELEQGWQRINFQMAQREASIHEPEIVEIAKAGMKTATERHNLNIREPEIAKPGRTYSGEISAMANDHILQQRSTGRSYIHNAQDIEGVEKENLKVGDTIKVSYESDGKAQILKHNNKELAQEKSLAREKDSDYDLDR